MARLKLHPMFEEVRGKFGEIVYRESYGTLHMSHIPDLTGIVPSAGQLEQRERFRQAAVYGHLALADPTTRTLYKGVADERNKPVLSVTIADFLNAPSIDELDVSEYEGSLGSPIYVRASDDFSVQTVQIKISDTDGQTLESGMAIVEAGTGRWKYTGQTNISMEGNIRIQVLVTDRPGNVTNKESTKVM